MKKQGKILRDPGAGPGIVIIEGQQHRFLLDEVWKSELPPKPGMSVEVKFDHDARIVAVSPTTDSQPSDAPAYGFLRAARIAGSRFLRKIAIK